MKPGLLPTAVGLVSMALIACQICLMEILSIVQWHHFGATVISIALLGFGASGSCLALARNRLPALQTYGLPLLMLLCGAAMALSLRLAQSDPVRFDSFLLFGERGHAWRLALTCLVHFLPFFLGAGSIGWALMLRKGEIGRIYGASLLGSGLGGPLALGLTELFMPATLPGLIAILPALAGALLAARRAWTLPMVALVVWAALHPPELVLSPFKDLRKALDLPGSRVLSAQNGPYGLVQVVGSPALRYAPGLSLLHQGPLPASPGVFLNGDWFGPLLPWRPSDRTCILDDTPSALPYALGPRTDVLVLDARTGADVIQALVHGARQVRAVEPNPVAASSMEREIRAGDRLEVHRRASRIHLSLDGSRYDLIVLPMLESSGLNALAETPLLTLEAVSRMLDRLGPQGVLSASCWLDQPPRNSLRLLRTLAEAMERKGLEPARHVAAARGWRTLTIVAKRSPLEPADISRVRRFCDELAFDPVILPGLGREERSRYHALQDGRWFDLADRILAGRRFPYAFRIAPPTDDRPYFHQFLTWRSLAPLRDLYGARAIPFFEIGYLILILTALLLTLPCLLLPLVHRRVEGRTILYFGSLGAGYLFLEMALIHRLTPYFGHPVLAAAAVISLMLLFSGLGSLTARPGSVRRALGGIVLLGSFYALGLPWMLANTLTLPLTGRVAVAIALIAPLAFRMGQPFPMGLIARPEGHVPWAWGINGYVSVVSAPLATIVAVELGFTWVMALGAAAYAAALFCEGKPALNVGRP